MIVELLEVPLCNRLDNLLDFRTIQNTTILPNPKSIKASTDCITSFTKEMNNCYKDATLIKEDRCVLPLVLHHVLKSFCKVFNKDITVFIDPSINHNPFI